MKSEYILIQWDDVPIYILHNVQKTTPIKSGFDFVIIMRSNAITN
ncbi:MAG TPA: hypothetical protein PLP23_00255 [Panacibacter sp.]|nr:hypothetical protein [Panacibacter sp.]